MRHVLAVLGAATPLLFAGVAHAAVAPSVPGLESGTMVFGYDPPDISEDGSHVTWHWTLTNESADDAVEVTLLHHLTPALDQVRATAPCTVIPKGIRCHYGKIEAGTSVEGTIDADLPSDLTGSVKINGRITWQAPSKTPAVVTLGAGRQG